MTDALITVVLAGLAGYRLSVLFVREDGPWRILRKLRHLFGQRFDPGTGTWRGGGVMGCLWCNSVWSTAAAYAALRYTPADRFVEAIAAMAVALVLAVYMDKRS